MADVGRIPLVVEPPPAVRFWAFVQHLARSVAAHTLPGLLAGLVAIGVGSRLAMRVMAITSGPEMAGAHTEAGAVVGEITFGGTMFLIVAGSFLGLVGGLLHMALSRWLPAGIARGPVFGGLLVALFGRLLVDPHNIDFFLLSPKALAVAMFSALPFIYGLLFVSLHRRLGPRLAATDGRASSLLLLGPALAPLLLIGPSGAAVVLFAIAAWALAKRPSVASRWRGPGVTVAGYVLLGTAAAVGSLRFGMGLFEILR